MRFGTYTSDTGAVCATPTAPASSDEARAHAARVATDVAEAVHAKYLRGQSEHGGRIWEKAGMLAHAENESRDLDVYQHVLREQLTGIRDQASALLAALDRVLGPPED